MPPLAPAQPGIWQICPQSSLIHPYSYLPLGLCPHHFPETVLARVLVPRTLLYPKFMWLLCHLTPAWSCHFVSPPPASPPPLAAHRGCLSGSPFLTICSTLMPLRLCVWAFPCHICSPGLPAHTHNFNFNINCKDAHISRPSSDLHLCSGLQTCPTAQQASQSVYTGGTLNQPNLKWTPSLPSPSLSFLYSMNGSTIPINSSYTDRKPESYCKLPLVPTLSRAPPTCTLKPSILSSLTLLTPWPSHFLS